MGSFAVTQQMLPSLVLEIGDCVAERELTVSDGVSEALRSDHMLVWSLVCEPDQSGDTSYLLIS